jgi:hypothetical protein
VSARRALFLLSLAPALLPGCSCAPKADPIVLPAPEPPEPEPAPSPTPTPQPQTLPPVVQSLSIATWPPVGPETEIVAQLSDDHGLVSVDFDFALHVTQSVIGKNASASVTGAELGEGLGTLAVTVHDVDLLWDEWESLFVLVDLTPPKGELLDPFVKLAPGEVVRVWVADAWVLGGAELTFGGVTQTWEFEPGYPGTLGNEWDTSLVAFPADAFPEGSGKAELRVWDAVGNEVVEEVDLALDGTPPVASILSPTADSVLSGWVDVTVGGSDPGDGPVEIDVSVGGSPLGTLDGPVGTVGFDTSELAKGTVLVEAVARDAAGNESPVASVSVVIQ